MISTFEIKPTKGTHGKPPFEIMLKRGGFINELPTRRRKDSDNENDRKNGLKMKTE